MASLHQSALTRTAWRNHHRIIARDGTVKWILAHSMPRVRADRSTEWCGTLTDETARVRAQEEVRETSNRLADVLAAIPAAVVRFRFSSLTGTLEFLFATERLTELLGVTPAEAMTDSTSVMSLVDPQDAHLLMAEIRARAADLMLGMLTFRVRHRGGSRLWMRLYAKPDQGPEGAAIFTATLTDVTTQVELSHRADESSAVFRELAASAPVVVWQSDIHQNVIYLSPGWQRLTGHAEAEALGTGWARFIHGDDLFEMARNWNGAFSSRQPLRQEFRLGTPEIGWTWMLAQAVPVFRSAGEFAGFVGTLTDISQQRAMIAAMEQARLAAEDANRAKSDFLANMSHEIRTPMAAILGYAELLGDTALSSQQQAEHVETIRRNGTHLLTVINDILDISRIEAGELRIEHGPVDPRALVTEVAELLRVRADHKGLRLTLDLGTELPRRIRGDASRLRQVLVNLVGNAIKFTEAGSVCISARLTSSSGPATIDFLVADTGIGMDADTLARIFRPFSQADASMSRRFGGTGLGLSISKGLAELMGGTLMVSSTQGEGSCFTLAIPLEVAEVEPTPTVVPATGVSSAGATATAPCTDTAATLPLSDLRILLAEDGPDNQRLLSLHLRRAGAQVTVVENGRLAVDAIQAAGAGGGPGPTHFDLVLMDMQMPELDGYAAAATLRQRGYAGPIVALTAHAMAGDRERCIAAGCDEYLSKPADRQMLIGTVREMVDRGRRPAHSTEPAALVSPARAAEPDRRSQQG
jgi:PAS domain S-box-containing protein